MTTQTKSKWVGRSVKRKEDNLSLIHI